MTSSDREYILISHGNGSGDWGDIWESVARVRAVGSGARAPMLICFDIGFSCGIQVGRADSGIILLLVSRLSEYEIPPRSFGTRPLRDTHRAI